ncbi:hypothetical protein MNBD_GAMMA08-710 [hydrothermal vent metagenome]|uniref:AB hydrolase-1 domain-containing protein n=1 Tax=hydrothermal vent metagenome TaxID=652676 RepID=A0A3B0XRE6_9ZZZZ
MKPMINALLFIFSIYILICIILYFLQDKLIFFPPEPINNVYNAFSKNEINATLNNEQIHGWNIINPSVKNKTILYFGGNAQDVVYLNEEAKEFNVHQCIAFNYPGYGKSSGTPSQKSLYENALAAYDFAIKEYQLNPQDIIVVGRSLGSSVATYVAANREIAGLILITPFDSIADIAAAQYKIFPVKYVLKHPFPTKNYIAQVKVPTLMLAAHEDEIIADARLENLKRYSNENHKLIKYTNVGHNTIQEDENYYLEINKFIESL